MLKERWGRFGHELGLRLVVVAVLEVQRKGGAVVKGVEVPAEVVVYAGD